MKTKILTVLVAVTLVLAMAPLTGGAAFADEEAAAESTEATEVEVTEPEAADVVAEEPEDVVETKAVTKYNIWIGGKQVTSKAPSGKGWKYSEKNGIGTLTLNGAKITGNFETGGIYALGINLKIKLSGKNTITNNAEYGAAIRAFDPDNLKGMLTITGSGSLDAKSGGYGITARNISIDGPTIKVESTGSQAINTETSSDTGMIMINNAKVDAVGRSYYGIHAGTSLVITDSIVNAECKGGPGVWALYTVAVVSSKVTVTATAYAIIAENGEVVVCNEGSRYPARLEASTSNAIPAIRASQGFDFEGLWILEPPGAYVYDGGGISYIVKPGGEYPDPAMHVIIGKEDNTLNVKGKTAQVKYSKLKKKNQTVKASAAFNILDPGQGELTFKKASGNKTITVNQAGKITVKKGLKKGNYKVKVTVKATGNEYRDFATKIVTVTIRVK